MKLERAKELQAEIKRRTDALNEVMATAAKESLTVRVYVLPMQTFGAGSTEIISTSVKIRPDYIDL